LIFLQENISPEEARALAKALKGSTVTKLHIQHNNIELEGAIAEGIKGSKVKRLSINSNNIGPERR
jgi:hypothetical protein